METFTIDGIPLMAAVPGSAYRGLVVHIPAFTQTKEQAAPILEELAGEGLVAVAPDPWEAGERAREDRDRLIGRVFGNFRRNMWPILGQTTLEIPRIVDAARDRFVCNGPVALSGLSMGGDIAIAACGLDARIVGAVAVGATPDWLRPGMCDIADPSQRLPAGQADAYARFFYDALDPFTHPDRYARAPHLDFVCGERDSHVPPDGAHRFKRLLEETHPDAGARVTICMLPGCPHSAFLEPEIWWPTAFRLLTGLFA